LNELGCGAGFFGFFSERLSCIAKCSIVKSFCYLMEYFLTVCTDKWMYKKTIPHK
jgi:hypothetical protein